MVHRCKESEGNIETCQYTMELTYHSKNFEICTQFQYEEWYFLQTTCCLVMATVRVTTNSHMTSPGYTSHTFTIFPSKGHNAYSVLPYKYSNMANMAMYRENVHTWEILLIRPYHSCLPMYTHVQLSRQWVICSCCATTLGMKQRRVERLVML